MEPEVFIGMVGVGAEPGTDLLGDSKGAYVNVLAFASSKDEYEFEVKRAVTDLGLFAFEFEDVEPFEQRAAHRALDDTLRTLAVEVFETKQPRFAAFHTFANVDA